MFKNINIRDVTENKIIPHIIASDRINYIKYLQTAEEYAERNNFIVAGDNAMNKLLSIYNLTIFNYFFYSRNAYFHAKALTDIINQKERERNKEDPFLVYLFVDNASDIYTVNVNTRPLISIKNIDEFKLYITPLKLGGIFDTAKKMQFCSVELLLIDLYSKLTDYSYLDDYGKYLEYELALRKKFLADFKLPSSSSNGESVIKQDAIEEVIATEYLQDNNDSVLIYNNGNKFVILTTSPLGREIQILMKLCEKYKLGRTEFHVEDLLLPMFPRIKKANIKYEKLLKSKMKVFIELYTFGKPELISFHNNNDNVKCATPFIAAKIIMIEYWTIQILFKQEIINEDSYNKWRCSILAQYNSLFEGNLQAEDYFPVNINHYIGDSIAASIYNKRQKLKTRKLNNYYPIAR